MQEWQSEYYPSEKLEHDSCFGVASASWAYTTEGWVETMFIIIYLQEQPQCLQGPLQIWPDGPWIHWQLDSKVRFALQASRIHWPYRFLLHGRNVHRVLHFAAKLRHLWTPYHLHSNHDPLNNSPRRNPIHLKHPSPLPIHDSPRNDLLWQEYRGPQLRHWVSARKK